MKLAATTALGMVGLGEGLLGNSRRHLGIYSAASTYYLFPPGVHQNDGISPENCTYQLEIVQVQDVSDSYKEDLVNLLQFLPGVFDWIDETYPNTRYGLTTFTDKPLPSLGYWTTGRVDFCTKVNVDLLQPHSVFMTKLAELFATGGRNWEEAQLEAMLRTALAPQVQWTDPDTVWDPETGLPLVRVMLLVTDAMPNLAGAAKAFVDKYNSKNPSSPWGWDITPNTLAADPSPLNSDPNALCDRVDYPTLDEVSSVIKAKRILPVFLVAPASFTVDGVEYIYPAMKALYKETGNPDFLDPLKGMVAAYEYYLAKMDLPGVVLSVSSDLSDITNAMKNMLSSVQELVCRVETTTLAPTTSTPLPTTITPMPTSTSTPTLATTSTPAAVVTTMMPTTTEPEKTTIAATECPECPPVIHVNVNVVNDVEDGSVIALH